MTIKKRGPSLYEVLKDTLRRQEAERQRQAAKAPPPEVDVEDEEEESFAEVPEDEPEAEAVAEPEPEPQMEPEPEPDPEPEPEPEPPPAVDPARHPSWKSLGERTLVFTYNSAAFASLVLVTAIFAAYSAGLSRGRSELEVLEVPVTPTHERLTVPAPPNPPPAPAAAEWRVAVYAWKYDPNDPSRVLRRQLERAGFTDLLVREETTSRGGRVIVLYGGRFEDRRAAEADFLFRRLQGQSYQGRSLAEQVRWVRFEGE